QNDSILVNSSYKERKGSSSYMRFFNTEYFISDKEIIIVDNKRKEISYGCIKKQKKQSLLFTPDSSLIKTDSIVEISRKNSLVSYHVYNVGENDIKYTSILIDVEKEE